MIYAAWLLPQPGELLNISLGKYHQLNNLGRFSQQWGYDPEGFLLIIELADKIRFVNAGFAAPMRIGQKMRTGFNKQFDYLAAFRCIFRMRDLN